MEFLDFSIVADTALAVAIALIVWVAYREMRRRTHAEESPSHNSISHSAS